MGEPATVLVVDDEDGILKLLEAVLTGSGHSVLLADSGEKALEIVKAGSVEVALVDKNLPDMDGVDLVREIGEVQPDLVAVIMTGYGSLRSSLDALEVGVARYLLKPFEDIAVISRTVWDVLQERDARVRRRQSLVEADRAGPATEPLRVIVADADEADLELLAEVLAQEGCEVTRATCAQEALLKLAEELHEVLVVGYDMGDMTADDVLLRAKRISGDVAVVVTAASPSLTMTTSLIRRGAAGFIEKPLKDSAATARTICRQGMAARRRMAGEEEPEGEPEADA